MHLHYDSGGKLTVLCSGLVWFIFARLSHASVACLNMCWQLGWSRITLLTWLTIDCLSAGHLGSSPHGLSFSSRLAQAGSHTGLRVPTAAREGKSLYASAFLLVKCCFSSTGQIKSNHIVTLSFGGRRNGLCGLNLSFIMLYCIQLRIGWLCFLLK